MDRGTNDPGSAGGLRANDCSQKLAYHTDDVVKVLVGKAVSGKVVLITLWKHLVHPEEEADPMD